MGRNYVNVDRATPLLLPTDLRDWVAPDDPVHLVIEAVEELDLSQVAVNERGTGSAQYPPAMMLALLIYCYGQGIYSSRRIEAATHRDVAVRYLTGDTHPDHDTIAQFRRTHAGLLQQAFVTVLQLAVRLGVPRLGTIALDGTKLRANASARQNRRAAQLQAELAAVQEEVAARLQAAETADSAPAAAESLPPGLADRARRRAQLQAAHAALQQRATGAGRTPRDDESGNTTDPDSRVQRGREGFLQGYNAQLAVAAGSGLIVGAQVCSDNNDRRQLAPTMATVPPCAGPMCEVVADTGYDQHEQVRAVEQAHGAAVYVPPQQPRLPRYRQSRHDAAVTQERLARQARVESPRGQALLRLRRCLVEPVFGTLKAAWGFTGFRLRGLSGVNIEWMLVCVAYNLRKLHRWRLAAT